ncbi:DUF637 domain-containing protein [Pseudomonas sp. 5P_3.1_Bac2]|nr:DUF637 domain-containing protein [Pseudomonas sp. 5P_3.1_Bac2]MCU1716343.1 DUF637 domain-containing protein [Pseudomonas sp. 5P_3.1_Bac2]
MWWRNTQTQQGLFRLSGQSGQQSGASTASTGVDTLAAAANEDHEYSKGKKGKTTIQEDEASQQSAELKAGGDLIAVAGKDLTLLASKIGAGDEAYVHADNELNMLAAQDSNYSLYDMKKKGSWGSKKTQRDEVTQVTNVGSEITTGGDLTLSSGSDQRYQGAKLESGGDLTIASGGAVTFEAVKDLHQESHDKSSSSAVWNSTKNKGAVDETLRQSQLTAQGEVLIKAVDGLHIDVRQLDQKTISQSIDAMVEADPDLAWLKQVETRGDVDWRQVKEVHDKWSESHSGLGGPAMIVIAIIVTYFTAGAASGLVAGGASAAGASTAAGSAWAAGTAATATTAATAAGWANVAATAVLTSAASTGATSIINNRGNVGAALKDVTSGENLKGYATSAITAGFTAGVLDNAFGVTGDNVNKITKGFDLSKPSELAKFGSYLGAQGAIQAVAQSTVQGGSLSDNLQDALTGQLQHLLQAGAFN